MQQLTVDDHKILQPRNHFCLIVLQWTITMDVHVYCCQLRCVAIDMYMNVGYWRSSDVNLPYVMHLYVPIQLLMLNA